MGILMVKNRDDGVVGFCSSCDFVVSGDLPIVL